SDLLKQETGRSAKEHIHVHIIEKAKSMLLGSDKNMGEIAHNLGFEYSQHFSKFFKSKTGTSPSSYRDIN
ncbi:MAG: AraC family transcriptional activator of pobA, partial [Glaciecola sp.]